MRPAAMPETRRFGTRTRHACFSTDAGLKPIESVEAIEPVGNLVSDRISDSHSTKNVGIAWQSKTSEPVCA